MDALLLYMTSTQCWALRHKLYNFYSLHYRWGESKWEIPTPSFPFQCYTLPNSFWQLFHKYPSRKAQIPLRAAGLTWIDIGPWVVSLQRPAGGLPLDRCPLPSALMHDSGRTRADYSHQRVWSKITSMYDSAPNCSNHHVFRWESSAGRAIRSGSTSLLWKKKCRPVNMVLIGACV